MSKNFTIATVNKIYDNMNIRVYLIIVNRIFLHPFGIGKAEASHFGFKHSFILKYQNPQLNSCSKSQ